MANGEYDPYDERHYLDKCVRGYYIRSTRWCCRECWLEQRERIADKRNTAENIFNSFMMNEDINFKPDNMSKSYTPEELEWYKILKLVPPKNQDEIKKQYKKLALIYHPDRNIGASAIRRSESEEEFKFISSAYSSLIEIY